MELELLERGGEFEGIVFVSQENPINTPVSKASTLAAASLSCSRPTMFQRPPSQTTSTKAGPGSSSASAAFTSENYKKWVADSPFNSIPENVDLNSDNDMRVS